jgi:hypothetical protein
MSESFLAVPLIEVTSFMLSAVIYNRTFLTVRKSGRGQVWIPPGSLRFTRLSHSETVCDTAWAGPHRSHPPPTRAAPVCVGAREVAGHQTPGGMELAAR